MFAEDFSQGQVPAQAKQSLAKGGRCLVTAEKALQLPQSVGGLAPWLVTMVSGRDEQEGRVVVLRASSNVRVSNEGSTLSLFIPLTFALPSNDKESDLSSKARQNAFLSSPLRIHESILMQWPTASFTKELGL